MAEDSILIVDGHTHVTNRVYWEKIDPWEPQPFGFDYARAYDAGVRVVIENIAAYGYNNFNYTPKQVLRLIEIFHRVLERHDDRMGIVLRAGDAKKIVASGKMAVVLSVESGFDHEGDLDVLRSLSRLGLRGVQFATQTCCNAFADSSIGGPGIWGGINAQGHALVELMNELGILIDLTHASQETQLQVIAASSAPVVASHVAMEAVSGDGTPNELMSDEVLNALSQKGGMVGIIGVSTRISKRYRGWAQANSSKLHGATEALQKMVGFDSPVMPHALMHGEYGAWLDSQMRDVHLANFTPWNDDPESADVIPTADEWAAHVAHVLRTVGPEHVGIGLDTGGPRSSVLKDATGYPDLIAALGRITDEKNLRLIAGENWLRVLDRVLPGTVRIEPGVTAILEGSMLR